ncbi:MAG: transglutaminase domain-containing protein [Verrucomicrobiia bacterium]
MRAPPFLIGAALVFWGWHTGLFWVGAAAAVVLEASYHIKVRWEFSQSDLDRVWNLCVALFLGATVFAFFSGDSLGVINELIKDNSASSRLATINQSKRSLFQLLQWLPIMFLPMVLAQVYGTHDRLDLSTFSWWLRRKRGEPGFAQRFSGGLNVTYPFFVCCIFAASAGNERTLWFPAGLIVLAAAALWLHRSRSFRPTSWAVSFALAIGLGFGVHFGMMEVQKLLQRIDELLLVRWGGSATLSARENETRIGSIGRMKLSGRIVLRVEAPGQDPPTLLREASYDEFTAPRWSSSRSDFDAVQSDMSQVNWVLNSESQAGKSVRISGYVPGGRGLLAVPGGVAVVGDLPVVSVETNRLGSVRVDGAPGFVQFEAEYEPTPSIDIPPGIEDEQLPEREKDAVLETAQALGLENLTPEEAVGAIEEFFARHFTYSLWQGLSHRPTGSRTALGQFLLEHRSGHCEYFATATTLLLRAANIPARYATGYSVQEKRGRYYVVRERHAHAWCLAWINGAWRDIDTTPPDWTASDAQRASVWEPIRDALSRLWFEFSRWRWGHAEWKQYLLWLVVPLLALALAGLLVHKQWIRAQDGKGAGTRPAWPGLDSEFYEVEKALAKVGFPRLPGETGSAWIARVQSSAGFAAVGLEPLLAAHYRLRFDPRGLNAQERAHFRQQAAKWISEVR